MRRIKYGAVKIVVRRATVRDDVHAQIIERRLIEGVPEDAWGIWGVFAELCSQTIKAEGLPFEPTSLHEADKAAINAAYEAFLGLDKALKDLWMTATKDENRPVDEVLGVDLLPDNADPNS